MHKLSPLHIARNFFLPGQENRFVPPALSARALVYYGILTMLVLASLSPLTQTVSWRIFLGALSEEVILAKVNPEREAVAVNPLRVDPLLSEAARLKAEDMIARDYFSHYDPDGSKPWIWFKRVGYTYAAAGENLAIDFSDPAALMNAWLASPSHAKNIHNGVFADVGIGIAKGNFQDRETAVVVMFLGNKAAPTVLATTTPQPAPPPPETPPQPSPEPNPQQAPEPEPEPTQPLPQQEPTPTEPQTPATEPLIIQTALPAETQIFNAPIEEPNAFSVNTRAFIFTRVPAFLRIGLSLIMMVSLLGILIRPRMALVSARSLLVALFLLSLWAPNLI
ncbi:MAG: hypothetical protein A2806_01020 [Candidatus Terrybacteria bacterium RIFCSPHIGHO2_01_FULL_48_17]|uniref:SCP domain-containing protein n=1 Tax=Candidatus Terrybacteria bacterium RIFCSPHIGHO2_01_FULL_48_17 TaxID=1802362 RepID=A0A1G2PLS0_9BACT|nr:MAG: hypothetical protein A2806_01020 [Candidatus Terrybacteria bacterium RIFCSPHIGHO2_01_FULL_48_17]